MQDSVGPGRMPIGLFEYKLPARCIAQEPARPRDSSRLMLLPKGDGLAVHQQFTDLPQLLEPGDVLVVNRTSVIPARLRLHKPTGGRVELLLSRPIDDDILTAKVWEGIGRPGSALKTGAEVLAEDETRLEIERNGEKVRVRAEESILDLVHRLGEVPLPPYIERTSGPISEDLADYQTVFAAEPGAAAAPTAGLHFTDRVLQALQDRGVKVEELVLHVGPGTFLPIRREHHADVREHRMHSEWYSIPSTTVEAVDAAKAAGRRVVAVGTTSLRALETWKRSGATIGESTLFVYPGYSFQVVDGLLTNFHLPGSTLVMLVAALAGRQRILNAYREAVDKGYRFFSYGDAMLLI